MAKRGKGGGRGGVNKSQAIRDYLKEHAEASPSMIQEAMKGKGLDVSQSLASQVKYGSAKKKGGKRGKRGVRGTQVNLEDIVEVRKLANRLGGVDQLRKMLDALE